MDALTRILVFAGAFAAVMVIWSFVYTRLTGKPFIVVNSGTAPRHEQTTVSDPVTLSELQGTWRMIQCGRNGRFAPLEEIALADVRMQIRGDRFEMPGSGSKGRLVLHSGQLPTAMDQCGDDGSMHRCLVRMVDHNLEICQAEDGDPRPTDFSPKRRDNATLTRFTRVLENA